MSIQEVKTLALSFVVALGTLIGMAFAGFGFFVSAHFLLVTGRQRKQPTKQAVTYGNSCAKRSPVLHRGRCNVKNENR